jgi:hypothetical protein
MAYRSNKVPEIGLPAYALENMDGTHYKKLSPTQRQELFGGMPKNLQRSIG